MITLLEELVDRATGAYVDRQDLNKLEHLMFSWAERKEVYLAVQAKEKAIIDRAMQIMKSSPNLPKQAGDEAMQIRCCRDMTLTLRYYALGMLLQDKEMLKDRYLYWQKNILQAMGFIHGANYLQQALHLELPEEQADMLKPFFKLGHDMLHNNLDSAENN